MSLPLDVVVVTAFLALVFGLIFKGRGGRRFLLVLSLSGLSAAFGASFWLWRMRLFNTDSLLIVDPFAYFLYLLLLLIGFLTLLSHHAYLEKQGIDYPEVYPLTLFSLSGMMVMVSTTHLLMFFLGLEVMSLAVYVLVGIKRRDLRSNEGATKYFILGALVAGLLIYGISLFYGATGQLDLRLVNAQAINPPFLGLWRTAVILILTAFAFKVAAVPFHFWTPDVYEGAPHSVTGFMATAVKAAAFGALLRSLNAFVKVPDMPLDQILAFLCIATMIVGNLIALYQTNIKRMLAYSSIAHAGYILVGVAAAFASGRLHPESLGAPLFYLLAYAFMTLGAFAVAAAVAEDQDDRADIAFYSGLAGRSPKLAAAMAVFMVALTGIPPTVGFAGKFFVFREALNQGLMSLVIVGVLMSAVSAYYYLRVVVAMYFGKEGEEGGRLPIPRAGWVLATVIFFCFLGTLYFGVVPSHTIEMSSISGFTFLPKAITQTLP